MLNYIENLCQKAKKASQTILSEEKINACLEKIAYNIGMKKNQIIEENLKDIQSSNLSKALTDRLTLNEKRIDSIIESLHTIINLKSPVGEIIKGWKLKNDLEIEKVRVPIGTIAIIYEARPNVTVDAFALCFKSSNSCVLRGGKEAFNTNKYLSSLIRQTLESFNINPDFLTFIDKTERQAIEHLIKMDKYIDLLIPRGGESLITFISKNATVPVIQHYKGLCHLYIDESANIDMALNIAYNAKVQRPSVCNAIETLLVHKNIASEFLPALAKKFENIVELRGCENTLKILPNIKQATQEDWQTEYLDYILSIKIVDSTDQAIEHINEYGSKHSEAIVTQNYTNAEDFLNKVDAACVYVNASTRFSDGGEFGFGAEIGISTSKLHARGPMALEELTTYKYKIRGNGQIRS
ncbi:glutamate-5-semialdehyde dehydrogenase [Desulfurella multipotens]|uniref:glutamate-5-semialdehyde dehydrogenase n=1 Tax=Desulfurella TaxID=33001 RepID=UPI000CC7C7BB|nr:glutamate-5-semialdehyde dehydrogenase [Desulfurella multipotens]PMP65720.1 MAG: glutamate-5-semialdehyde dehydrogenase [Desulfurella multipotens]HEX13358.1 glutamate-5-semialdehyde dehydrogenase [Desulfurella acetivorans]